jgi:S1-C subfamily serine protease
MPLDSQPARSSLNGNWDAISKSVVLVEAEGTDCNRFGSGTIILDGSYVLTNQHVSGDGECELEVWFTDSASDVPTRSVRAALVVSDSRLDLAVIQLLDAAGNPYIDKTRVPLKISPIVPKLGDKLFILGYPGLGGSTITLTSGDFAGIALHYEVEYFKTTASLNRGVSGGTALSADGDFLGVPTAGTGADIACEDEEPCMVVGTELGLVRPISYAQDLIARMPD